MNGQLGLVELYLLRIEAYNQIGPALNAVIIQNPQVQAERLGPDLNDSGRPVGPLHDILRG